MAASKTSSYFSSRSSNYRYLSGDLTAPISTDSSMIFDIDESDLWNNNHNNHNNLNNLSSSPELRKTTASKRISKKSSSPAIGGTASSLPVNVPDWSKILKEDYRENNWRRDNDYNDDEDDDEFEKNGYGDRIPPHEFLARQLARTRIASFSVHEGIGRTLKGRDLSRVRNAIWEKTGFQD